ncbi:MAG: nucleotidyltransferase domain-containing protein [Nitrospirota bacterium]
MKAIWLDREFLLIKIKNVSEEASMVFPDIKEIRLFGSLAKGEETGLSDIDIFILAKSSEDNPIERIKPYFRFFSDKLGMAVDVIVAAEDEIENFKEILKESILLHKANE